MILECTLPFEAAHKNLSPQATEKTVRLHGHSYEVRIAVDGPVDPALGWVMDFGDVKAAARSMIERLDHRVLNDIDGMGNGTVVDVERWLTKVLSPDIPLLAGCTVRVLGEKDWSPRITRTGAAERLHFGFAAAHFLPALPDTHKCRRMHGHSFHVEIQAADAGRLAEPLADIYDRLDHRVLNELPGLANPTSEMIALWLQSELARRNCQFDTIRIAETCTSACVLTRN